MRTIAIGVDLAEQVFPVCSVDAAGRVEDRRDLRREAFKQWLPNVPAGTTVAMEACSGAHHWGRRCQLARGEHYDADAWLKHPMVQRPTRRRRASE